MEDNVKQSRRQLLKMGSIALVAAPMVGFNTSAFAHQNTAVRAALKFQNMPNGDKQCSKCMNFLPNNFRKRSSPLFFIYFGRLALQANFKAQPADSGLTIPS